MNLLLINRENRQKLQITIFVLSEANQKLEIESYNFINPLFAELFYVRPLDTLHSGSTKYGTPFFMPNMVECEAKERIKKRSLGMEMKIKEYPSYRISKIKEYQILRNIEN